MRKHKCVFYLDTLKKIGYFGSANRQLVLNTGDYSTNCLAVVVFNARPVLDHVYFFFRTHIDFFQTGYKQHKYKEFCKNRTFINAMRINCYLVNIICQGCNAF